MASGPRSETVDAQVGERIEIDLDLLGDLLEQNLVTGLRAGQRDEVALGAVGTGNGIAVWACRRMAEQLDEAILDLVGHDVLPPESLYVGLVPGQADDVGQQALGQAVLAHD